MKQMAVEGRPEEVAKKAYAPPVLVVYGNLTRITQAVAMNSATMDGGTGQTDKTA